MPRSDEAQAFFHAVYSAVQEIPYGKVTSYGHIAKLVGTRKILLLSLSSTKTHSYTIKTLSKHPGQGLHLTRSHVHHHTHPSQMT